MSKEFDKRPITGHGVNGVSGQVGWTDHQTAKERMDEERYRTHYGRAMLILSSLAEEKDRSEAEQIIYERTLPYGHDRISRLSGALTTVWEQELIRQGRLYDYDDLTMQMPHVEMALDVLELLDSDGCTLVMGMGGATPRERNH